MQADKPETLRFLVIPLALGEIGILPHFGDIGRVGQGILLEDAADLVVVFFAAGQFQRGDLPFLPGFQLPDSLFLAGFFRFNPGLGLFQRLFAFAGLTQLSADVQFFVSLDRLVDPARFHHFQDLLFLG